MEEKENTKIIEMIDKLVKDKYIKAGWFDINIKDLLKQEDLLKCINNCTSPSPNEEDFKNNEDFIKEKLKLIFKAFSLFKPDETKVLILGQDPYPSGKATGLAFLLNKKVTGNDSLYYILKAINKNKDITPKNIDNNVNAANEIRDWVSTNKVLLLNTALTHKNTDKETIGHHREKWNSFIQEIITKLVTIENKKLVVFLWGDDAKTTFHNAIYNKNKKKDIIVEINCENLLVLSTSHPSKQGYKYGFCYEAQNHFKVCNSFLQENTTTEKKEINWESLLNIYIE